MSAKSELYRDKDGFLNCNDCPRRYLSEILFVNHLFNEHKKETETKVNQHTQNLKDYISFPNNTQSEEDCVLDNILVKTALLKDTMTLLKDLDWDFPD